MRVACLTGAFILLLIGRSGLGQAPILAPQHLGQWSRSADAIPVVRRLPPVSAQYGAVRFEEPLWTDDRVLPVSFEEGVADPTERPGGPLLPEGSVESAYVGPSSAGEGGSFEGLERGGSKDADFYAPSSDFSEGLVVRGPGMAMKISGYVKVDLIYDFDPIDNTDVFDTTMIPVGAPPRTNSRFHARQSRLNFDTRWPSDLGRIRVFVEGDFFSDGDRFRLRHAYGELGSIVVGKTWTTFTDMKALPNTLDFEGAVSSISRRQAQVRWTHPLVGRYLTVAAAVEDSRQIFDLPEGDTGEPRTISPDFIARLRYSPDWGQFQVAGLIRELGFQPAGQPVTTDSGWGWNFSGALFATQQDKVYYQIFFGDGIGSYRGLADVVADANEFVVVPTFGWMVGWAHDWCDSLSSNFTYSVSSLENAPFEAADNLHENKYLAVNLIWKPTERMFVGVEYLFGTRENKDGSQGEANRVQASFGFYLP